MNTDPDYRLLADIAKNSERDSYITNRKLEVLWTNCDVPFENMLKGLRTPFRGGNIRHETVYSCWDGRALRITPILEEGRLIYLFFELYTAGELLLQMSGTTAFAGFAKAATELRLSMIDYAASLGVSHRELNHSNYGKLCSESVNLIELLNIAGNGGFVGVNDMTSRYTLIACWFDAAAARSGKLIFEHDIDLELYSIAEKTAMECALTNLLMNCVLHAVPPEGEKLRVKFSAYAEAGMVVADIQDNGTEADPEYVGSFRTLYRKNRGESIRTGLGIALAEIFCKRFGGRLLFSKAYIGGLRVRLELPLCRPDDAVMFFSPPTPGRGISYAYDLMRKGFSDDELEDIVLF